MFTKIAGVLALHGLGVLDANALSSDEGVALARFRAESSFGPVIPWDRVDDLARASRAASPSPPGSTTGPGPTHRGGRRRPRRCARGSPSTTGLGGRASSSTFRPDSVGLLHCDLGARRARPRHPSAKVSTIGPQVVDALYVRTSAGEKLTDDGFRREVERAILHAASEA